MTFNFLGPGLTVNVEAKVKEQIILDSSVFNKIKGRKFEFSAFFGTRPGLAREGTSPSGIHPQGESSAEDGLSPLRDGPSSTLPRESR